MTHSSTHSSQPSASQNSTECRFSRCVTADGSGSSTETPTGYVRRRLAPPGLEGLLLELSTFSVTRFLFLLSVPLSLEPLSLSFSLSLLLGFSVIFTEELLPAKKGRGQSMQEVRPYTTAKGSQGGFIQSLQFQIKPEVLYTTSHLGLQN